MYTGLGAIKGTFGCLDGWVKMHPDGSGFILIGADHRPRVFINTDPAQGANPSVVAELQTTPLRWVLKSGMVAPVKVCGQIWTDQGTHLYQQVGEASIFMGDIAIQSWTPLKVFRSGAPDPNSPAWPNDLLPLGSTPTIPSPADWTGTVSWGGIDEPVPVPASPPIPAAPAPSPAPPVAVADPWTDLTPGDEWTDAGAILPPDMDNGGAGGNGGGTIDYTQPTDNGGGYTPPASGSGGGGGGGGSSTPSGSGGGATPDTTSLQAGSLGLSGTALALGAIVLFLLPVLKDKVR